MVRKACAIFMTTLAPLFTKRVWPRVHVLRVGAMLTPGQRTVTAALRVMGLAHAKSFQPSHRVLNRAVWSSLEGSRRLLHRLVHPLAPTGPLVLGWDDTIERRRGAKMRATGMSREPGRSSHRPVVQASGWRWFSLMRLAPRPWAKRVWALPVLTGLAPAARDHQARGQRHQQRTEWARHRRLRVRRWVPEHPLGLVPARRVAVMTWRQRLRRWAPPLGRITRVRWAAALEEPAPPRQPRPNGRPRVKGRRWPTWAPVLAPEATRWTTVTVRGW
jgi:hypothetical protein